MLTLLLPLALLSPVLAQEPVDECPVQPDVYAQRVDAVRELVAFAEPSAEAELTQLELVLVACVDGPITRDTVVRLLLARGGRFLRSKRDAVTLYDVVFGLGVSPSSIIAMERRMAAAAADPVQDAMEWVRSAPVVHPDETSWRQAKKRAWLWTAATDAVAIFNIHRSRSQEAAKELLGADFAGAICSDRFGAYNRIDRRGYCWAHLKRDFQAMADRFGSEWYGLRLVAGAKRVMAAWRMHRDGEIDRQTRDQRLSEERRRIHRLLVAAKERAPAPKTRRECAELLKTEARMWTFVDIDGMPPTNNLAERCLRRAVIWRKKCFGTDSEAGSRFVACILTVVTTLQMQQRGAFEFLVHAQEASFRGSQPPSLCPTT